MPFSATMYSEADLPRLLAFVTEAHGGGWRSGYFHVGDLIWGFFQNVLYDPTQNIRLWEDKDGALVGWAWFEKAMIELQVHPRLHGQGVLEPLMLDWAEEMARQRKLENPPRTWVRVNESNKALLGMLAERGFERDPFHYLTLYRDLNDPIPDATLPERCTVRHVAGQAEFGPRVNLHRVVWHPSKVTLPAYRRLRAAPIYQPELDLVAVLPDGDFGAYCICWYDPVNRVGEFEPVGTHPEHRGKGLGKGVMLEGLRRLKARGAQAAVVHSVGGAEAANRLYESVGFREVDRVHLHFKVLA